MNQQDLIKKCKINKDAIDTRPFKDEYSSTVVMRHKSNNKWFGLIFTMDNELCINLKCPPDLIPILKDQFTSVKPAWHMNKKHWCTIEVNNIPAETLSELIKISFKITAPKKKTLRL